MSDNNSSSDSTNIPKIDTRNYKDIFEELKRYSPFYVPEWDSNNENDIGVALSKIFSHIMIYVIDRLNKTPQRNYIEFLNMLGVKLSSALPASANVILFPSEGIKDDVLVSSGSHVVAPANDKHDEISFETNENLLVTPAKLVDVWSTSGRKSTKDGIYLHTQDHINNTPFTLFFGNNMQKHILYMLDNSTFNIKSDSKIVIQFKCNNAKALFAILKDTKWAYNWEPDVDNANEEIASQFYTEVSYKENICTVYLSLINFGPIKFDKYILKVGDSLNLEVESNADVEQPLFIFVKSTTDPNGKRIGLNRVGDSTLFNGNLQLVSKETLSLHKYDEAILIVQEGDIVTATFVDNDFEYSSAGIVNSNGTAKVKENKVDSITGYWIRCSLSPEYFVQKNDTIKSLTIDDIKIWNQPILSTFKPDLLFYNNVPLLTEPIFPFGEKPIILDTFYIACESVLSKKNASINLSFKCLNVLSLFLKSNKPILIWEYWNGITWANLKLDDQISDPDNNLLQWIKFTCPDDMSQTSVNGLKNFWIRSRIISGDYGKEKLIPVGTPPEYRVDVSEILFPKIFNVELSFTPNPKQPENCIGYNNLEYVEHTIKTDRNIRPFVPFYGLADDDVPALYLGFDRQPSQGPINLYISVGHLERQDNKDSETNTKNNDNQYSSTSSPFSSISYYYYSNKEQKWKDLDIIDETQDFVKSGYLKILFPFDFSTYSLFGKDLYWIKAMDTRSLFASAIRYGKKCPCQSIINGENTDIKVNSGRLLPLIRGLYLNAVPSMNLTKVEEEIIGSSNGEQNQSFKFSRTPVVSSGIFQTEVWINETQYIYEEDLENLKKQQEKEVREVKGLDGVVREIWIRWHEVQDIVLADYADRCYESDNAVGLIKFGDGTHGKIPPIGRDNIKSTYYIGGGIAGNVKQGEINSIKSPLPFVDSVINPEIASGGMDIGNVNDVLSRGPQFIKHRRQAVTAEDFELLIKDEFSYIAKVKCLSNSWTRGEFKPGHVVVVVVPQSSEDKPMPSIELMDTIEKYLHTCSSNIVVFGNNLRVIPPVFIKVSVTADVYPKSIELLPEIEKDSMDSLKKFLHPLYGGVSGNGWDLGSLLCFSDIYYLFHKIDGIDHIENLSIDFELEENGMAEDMLECKRVCKVKFDDDGIIDPSKNILPVLKHSLIFSGEHVLVFKFLKSFKEDEL
jgi:Baseplate J-like protein